MRRPSLKQIGLCAALILPAGLQIFWALSPAANVNLAAPLFHFHIVSFTTFAATVVSIFVTISVGETALPRHLVLAIAFAWMGAVFFIHGVTTPDAVMAGVHPALVWSAWLTFLGGGLLFLAGAFAPSTPDRRYLRGLASVTLAVYLAYAAVATWAADWLGALLKLRTPPLDAFFFVVTLLIWLASAAQHTRNYRRSRNTLDGLMAFESVWFSLGTISLFQFNVWTAAWWLYHVLMLAGFLVAISYLWRSYEQIRAFRLSRYFAAASLIVTAALALISAQLYASLMHANLTQQVEVDAARATQALAQTLATAAQPGPAGWETPAAQALARAQADHLHFAQFVVYNLAGQAVFGAPPDAAGGDLSARPDDLGEFQEALRGETVSGLAEPTDPPASYTPAKPVSIAETYLAVHPADDPAAAPIGVVLTLRAAPELDQSLIFSRQVGLALAVLSLGALFLALGLIVRRADQILSTRTQALERAYADLRRAEGLRDDLTNMIVHDLRNPLTGVMANLDLLNRSLAPLPSAETATRYLARGRAASQRMLGMIDELLNVSKFEAGEMRSILSTVVVSDWLLEKEASYRPQVDRDHKTLRLAVAEGLPPARFDVNLIGRVLDNLISNALKYTLTGGCLVIRAERVDSWLQVSVEDDGQGIPPEYHRRIFEKFVQVTDEAGVPLRKGTGLGLAFCRLAVEAHGGRIWVESTPGQGSVFSFTLPLDLNGAAPKPA